jgi:hypothetical protein
LKVYGQASIGRVRADPEVRARLFYHLGDRIDAYVRLTPL